MGILDKITTRWRTEALPTAQRIYTGYDASKSSSPTFVPDQIIREMWSSSDMDHLSEMARKNPLATYICRKIAENVYDDWFTLVDDDNNEHPMNKAIQRAFTAMNAKFHLTQALYYERVYGWSWLYSGTVDLRTDISIDQPVRTLSLDVFNPQTSEVREYDRLNRPSLVRLKYSQNQQDLYQDSAAEDLILWRTRPVGRSYKGCSTLEPIWNELVYLMLHEHSLYWYNAKIGLGFLLVKLRGQMDNKVQTALENALKDMSTKRVLSIEDRFVADMEFISASGATSKFSEDTDVLLGLIAAGCGIPKDILSGVSAGKVTGSETNVKALFATLNQIQRAEEVNLRELIRRMGYLQNDYHFMWGTQFPHNEEEQSKIEMNRSQSLAISSMWRTINEIRDLDGLPPIKGGDRLKDDFIVSMSNNIQTPEEQEQTHNPEGQNL